MSRLLAVICVSIVAVAATHAAAQTTQPQEQPVEQLKARVAAVAGSVFWAPPGASPIDHQAWTPVKVGDEYPAGTQIKTALRSEVVLMFGDDTVVRVERMTLASIEQFHKSATTKTTRVGLGYGAVRAGVAEGALRSDFAIDSPVATLSKRGTEGIYFFQEPRTGRFFISLARQGELEILQQIRRQLRLLRPGENTTNRLLNFILSSYLDRNFNFFAANLSPDEVFFQLRNETGLAVLNPGAGSGVLNMAGKGTAGMGQPTAQGLRDALRSLLASITLPQGRFPSESFFGTGAAARR